MQTYTNYEYNKQKTDDLPSPVSQNKSTTTNFIIFMTFLL